MVNSRIWIQSCLYHGTVGRTKLTRKNKTDIKRNRDAKQREFSKKSHNSDCFWGCLHRCHFGGLIICICKYLSLEQHRLELHVPTYMWIPPPPINPMMWSCGCGGSTMKFSTAGRIWKTQQRPQDWKTSGFIAVQKKVNAKECWNCRTIALISHASKVMLKIF